MSQKKGTPTAREIRSQKAQQPKHHPGTEKGVKWSMAVKDGSRPHAGPVQDTGLRGDASMHISMIQRALDSDRNLSGYGLKATESNGVIQITGIVDILQEKYVLRDLLAGLGVEKFQDAVSISTDGRVSDGDVITEVRVELGSNSRLDGTQINVKCNGSTVILTGSVPDREQRKHAEESARTAKGVTGVQNYLQIDADDDLTPGQLFHSQVNNEGPHPSP